jgi:hypothetical protein
VAFTVTRTGSGDRETRIEHPEADTVAVEDGHLVLRAHRSVVGIYAPGCWSAVAEVRAGVSAGDAPGRRAALVGSVPA